MLRQHAYSEGIVDEVMERLIGTPVNREEFTLQLEML